MLGPQGYLVIVLCHGDPVTLCLQDQPLHLSQQIIDGLMVGWASSWPLFWVWMVAGWSAHQLSLILNIRLSSPVLPQL